MKRIKLFDPRLSFECHSANATTRKKARREHHHMMIDALINLPDIEAKKIILHSVSYIGELEPDEIAIFTKIVADRLDVDELFKYIDEKMSSLIFEEYFEAATTLLSLFPTHTFRIYMFPEDGVTLESVEFVEKYIDRIKPRVQVEFPYKIGVEGFLRILKLFDKTELEDEIFSYFDDVSQMLKFSVLAFGGHLDTILSEDAIHVSFAKGFYYHLQTDYSDELTKQVIETKGPEFFLKMNETCIKRGISPKITNTVMNVVNSVFKL